MSEWTDIGEQLRKARESKDLELQDVAHSTRIPLATLAALEESDYSIFPSPTYARSFLSQYSEFLEVDAHEWIDAFETGDVLSGVNDHGYLQDDHDHIGSTDVQPSSSRKKSSPSRSRDRSREEKSSQGGTSILQTLTVFLVTALLIAGGIYAYKKYEPMLSGSADEEEAESGENPAVPTEVEGNPDGAEGSGNSTQVATTNTGTNTPPKPGPGDTLPPGVTPNGTPKETAPETTKPRTGPPPKALVIEDEDE